jgi:molybdopterin-guanine dinucleotide biosynthesis protein A
VGRLGGIVLAGGGSTRMGADKALLDWGGLPLVVHVAGVLRAAVTGPVVVVGARGQPLPPLPAGVTAVEDAVADRGPLEGLHAGLAALEGRAEQAFVAPVDAVLLRPGVIDVLEAARARVDARAAVARIGGDPRPLPAVYGVDLAPVARALLEAGERRLRALARSTDAVVVPEHELRAVDPELLSFAPMNTPAELDAARRAAGRT